MQKIRTILPIAFLALICGAAPAIDNSATTQIFGYAGRSFGSHPDGANLKLAGWVASDCECEQVYYDKGASRREAAGEPQPYWPGPLYHYFNGALYAVHTELPNDQSTVQKVLRKLEARFGPAQVRESWAGAPPDSYVYQNRLQTYGWRSADGGQVVWMNVDAEATRIHVIDNSTAAVRSAAVSAALNSGATAGTAASNCKPPVADATATTSRHVF